MGGERLLWGGCLLCCVWGFVLVVWGEIFVGVCGALTFGGAKNSEQEETQRVFRKERFEDRKLVFCTSSNPTPRALQGKDEAVAVSTQTGWGGGSRSGHRTNMVSNMEGRI